MKVSSVFHDLRDFLILWLTQSFSALGSAMTSFALVIWAFQGSGSALTTALLSVCSYGPYVVMSIFAGALTDRWDKKKVMLVCDTLAALCTLTVLILFREGALRVGHLYLLNAVGGLMNTVQQPAADVTGTLLTPKKYYQRIGGLKALSNSVVQILAPVLATAMLTLLGLQAVILFDLATFAAAFVSLLLFVRIPRVKAQEGPKESMLLSARRGLTFLRRNRGILDLILFLSAINLTASVYNAAFPAMLLSRNGGGETALGVINTVTGVALLAGSVAASLLPAPKSRVRVICNTLLLSMSTENLLLALGRSLPVWCVGGVLGWIGIPLMNANMDVVMRMSIPLNMQGRVYAARNTLQFFTIPVGYLLGGMLVDSVFEPLMAAQPASGVLVALVGSGRGTGAALLFLILALLGTLTCVLFRRDRHIWGLENQA